MLLLSGLQYALDAYKIQEEWLFGGFHDWVANYYDWKESTAAWKNIILKECEGDVSLSVDVFFKLYDLFQAEKAG